jgi:hypothetical protein
VVNKDVNTMTVVRMWLNINLSRKCSDFYSRFSECDCRLVCSVAEVQFSPVLNHFSGTQEPDFGFGLGNGGNLEPNAVDRRFSVRIWFELNVKASPTHPWQETLRRGKSTCNERVTITDAYTYAV